MEGFDSQPFSPDVSNLDEPFDVQEPLVDFDSEQWASPIASGCEKLTGKPEMHQASISSPTME